MIVGYADASVKEPIVSVGYVLVDSAYSDQSLLETGTRIINTETCDRVVEWTSHKAEYWAAIIATRAALDYNETTLLLHLDSQQVVEWIREEGWKWEQYFPHTFRSFANRFDDWHISVVHRENNEVAHKQARVGLKVGQEINEGYL